jgi:hypothetical protein
MKIHSLNVPSLKAHNLIYGTLMRGKSDLSRWWLRWRITASTEFNIMDGVSVASRETRNWSGNSRCISVKLSFHLPTAPCVSTWRSSLSNHGKWWKPMWSHYGMRASPILRSSISIRSPAITPRSIVWQTVWEWNWRSFGKNCPKGMNDALIRLAKGLEP